MVRAALQQWFRPRRRNLPIRLALPPVRRVRRIIPKLEFLEAIEAPGNLLALTAPLGAAAALVRTTEQPEQTPAPERPRDADTARDLPTEEDKALPALVSRETAAQEGSFSVDYERFLAAAAPLLPSSEDAEPKHTADDPALDPVMATGDALIDPLSHADTGPDPGAKSGSHHAGPSAGNGVNGTPPNLAGAYAGAGQGPGGVSTPAASGGGGSSGGSGGGPIGGNLATLANQGAFANAAGTTVATQTAAIPQTPTANVAPATAAIATPLTQTAPVNTQSRNTLIRSVLSSNVQSGPVPFTVYNTGVDDSGTPLAAGSADPHYQITAAPSPYAPGNAYVTQPTSYPFAFSNPWQPNGDGLSQWIGPVADEQNDPSGQYTYETTFDLTGDNVNLQLSATQVDNDPITYDASNLPDGLDIDPYTGIISGTVDPSAATGMPYAATVTATDGATNLSTSQTFNWTITTSTAAPVWTAPGNQSNAAGDDVFVQLSAANANNDNLTYTATGLPPGLTLDPIAGIITGTLPNSAASSTSYNVTVTASNGISSSSQTFNWNVNPISLPNPGDQSNLDGDSVSLQTSATDASNGTFTTASPVFRRA